MNRGNELATVNMDIDPSGAIHIAANVTQIRPGAKIKVTKSDSKTLSMAVRILRQNIPHMQELGIPAPIQALCDTAENGLILFCGATACNKCHDFCIYKGVTNQTKQ